MNCESLRISQTKSMPLIEFNLTAEVQNKMSGINRTLEKIKNLEAEKKNIFLEIDELEKTADAMVF